MSEISSTNHAFKNFAFLDAYRGLAVLSVVCQHTELVTTRTKLYQGGWFGVTAFFQLSAFLLTYRLIVQYERAHKLFHVTLKYIVMRFCRIYLTYLVFCVIHFVYVAVTNGPRYDFLYMVLMRIDLLDPKLGFLWTLPLEVGASCLVPVSTIET